MPTPQSPTPTPWYFTGVTIHTHGDVGGKEIAQAYSGEANAAFIVTACNCHDDLVEALTKLTSETEAVCTGEFGQDWADHFTPLWNLVNVARAALDKAKKGA